MFSNSLRNVKDKRLNFSWIEFAIIAFFSACYMLPSFEKSFPFLILLGAKILYMFFVGMVQPKNSVYVLLSFVIFVFIGVIYALLTDTSTISASVSNYEFKSAFSKFNQYFNMFFPAFITFRIAEFDDIFKKRLLLLIISAMLIYVIYVTIKEIEINPDITRTWSGFGEASENNVASYYFIYAVPIIIGTFVICFNRCKSVLLKIFLVAIIIYCFYFLLKAQYTLALLIAVIGLTIGLLKSFRSNMLKVAVLFIAVAILVFMGDILQLVASKVESKQMATRLEELANFFTSGDATGYNLGARLSLYWRSILAFFKSPIWGNRSLDFDGHATFLTVLSDTGIIGGIPFYYLYFSMRRQIAETLKDKDGFFNVSFIMLVLMGLTNPIHAAYPVGFTVWFVVPLIIMVLNENKNNVKGDKNEQMGN